MGCDGGINVISHGGMMLRSEREALGSVFYSLSGKSRARIFACPMIWALQISLEPSFFKRQ